MSKALDNGLILECQQDIQHYGEALFSPQYVNSFVKEIDKLITTYEVIFPVECALIYQTWVYFQARHLNATLCLHMINKHLGEMMQKFDTVYKPPKLFINHSEKDKEIVDAFVGMLERLGVGASQLFCSSISGYGVPQGVGDLYEYIRNEMTSDNLFVIMVLSKNYYRSPMCLNEMGAAWVKQAKYQSILLPGFKFPNIKGAINPRDISFELSNKTNRQQALNELKDNIVDHLQLPSKDVAIWERIRSQFLDEADKLYHIESNT